MAAGTDVCRRSEREFRARRGHRAGTRQRPAGRDFRRPGYLAGLAGDLLAPGFVGGAKLNEVSRVDSIARRFLSAGSNFHFRIAASAASPNAGSEALSTVASLTAPVGATRYCTF